MLYSKSPTTQVTALIEVVLVPSLAVAFHRMGLGLGWALFSAVLVLTVLWLAVWLLAKERAAEAPLKVITKSVLLNAAFTAFAPFVPMARWLNRGVGLSKQWSGFLTFVAFVVTVFVVFVVSALIPRKGEKEAAQARASAKSRQEEAPRPASMEDMIRTFHPDWKPGDENPK
ncbi:hypothetical protein GCM10011579_018560 [Streptomyces albiflavescens]|uniref:Uncharacterized protein n=1 Tax=Streptomyces albiflavescens TaxID=1623582 RepID=A0A917XYD8_9ACTN|nr:hypothetical protein GCM10011579_018560 [Streptomyces albiflavescens]